MQQILFYSTRDAYGELSNFASYPIYLEQRRWPTSEHYFQAQKFTGRPDEEEIRCAASAKLAAELGRQRRRPLRQDWESVKETVMLAALRAKFSQHQSLTNLLLGTGDARLVEHTARDAYWGDGGDGSGRNRLGVLLMQVRDELRAGKLRTDPEPSPLPETADDTVCITRAPLLTLEVHEQLLAALQSGTPRIECSLDLKRSHQNVDIENDAWIWQGQRFAYLEACKAHTVYHWTGTGFEPIARFTRSLVKLVPTPWGPPTFEIDGIKMLPSEHVSPYADAERKVDLVRPRGKVVLDTCGGLGYFAACCLQREASEVWSYEKNTDVLWLRTLNPWSPSPSPRLRLAHGDITEEIARLPDTSVDAILHDPPRFGIAGELYSLAFYLQLARVLRPRGQLFHYVGTPNKLTSGRDVPREVSKRLEQAGFVTRLSGDGVLANKRK